MWIGISDPIDFKNSLTGVQRVQCLSALRERGGGASVAMTPFNMEKQM